MIQPPAHRSAAGDPVRRGRVSRAAPDDANAAPLRFEDRHGVCHAVLGVVVVGQITADPSAGYFWSCFLPQTPRQQPAGDVDKARRALEFKVREWCEAAGVVVAGAPPARWRESRP